MELYTYTEAAQMLGLTSRSTVHWRIAALKRRGTPLTIEGGDLVRGGRQRFLTEQGIARLRTFEKRKDGRPLITANKGDIVNVQ